MRLLTSKLLRRSPQSPPPPLHHFFSHYYSSYSHSPSHSLFSFLPHNHRRRQYNCKARCSELHSLSPQYCFNVNRRYSTQHDFSESGELLLPVSTLISLLDSYHHITGFPWWVIISSSTVALRLAIFPLIVVQLRKMKRIGELLPTLPPPLPPPLSGRSFRDQFALFWKEKKAAGCPSIFWFFSSFVVQGGALWFQNLTEYPHGALGPIFPLLIAGLHFTNVQMSFQKTSLQQLPGTLGLLAKLYRIYLQLLTLPILFATFNVPQWAGEDGDGEMEGDGKELGSLVYWLTNSSLSLLQLLCFSHPGILEYFGLPKKGASVVAPTNKESHSGVADIIILTKQGEIPAQSLSPVEMVSYSIKILTDGRTDAAIRLLRLAIEKDPGYVRALLIMGQTLLQNKQLAEATECLESAIAKLLVAGYPTEVEEVDLLILSSQWAGIANAQQGKMEESLRHLERIAQLEEPGDSKSKAHYYDGLFIFSSALLNVNRKAEALKYLQKAAAYDPRYNVHFEHLETHLKDFAGDLASSRRDF
ncbi:hypothetical protein BUALT_Bualt07G0174600 [Buddleja alternifolia]|uniref:ALBINO3-like protein 3, mitochondrial n=1 Tax=Buddleja alternifolia TaxID=168488 RepID=A0AAV6XCT5_9LAMI|nr:hypothetical protein BUALT_Bualt07G0174600 [Buddleja alternifolia]